jgi:hypothetical protein
MSTILTILGIGWSLSIAIVIVDIAIPYALYRFAEYRWRRRHPDMPLSQMPPLPSGSITDRVIR